MIRKLILQNRQGKKYDLLQIDKSPTFQVEGFGWTDNTDFVKIGTAYYPLEESAEQVGLKLNILLWKNVDRVYKEFVNFCRHNPLTLTYGDDVGDYYFPCRLSNVSRIEKVGIPIKGVEVGFLATCNPYKILTDYNQGETGRGKQYPYTYPYIYSNDVKNMVRIRSDSYLHSPVILTIYGEAINPVWRHYCNGILVETGAYSGTIQEGHYLVIDAKSMPYKITEYDASGTIVADRYALCDFSTERFVHACEGANNYVVGHDGINAIKIKAEAYIEYESV